MTIIKQKQSYNQGGTMDKKSFYIGSARKLHKIFNEEDAEKMKETVKILKRMVLPSRQFLFTSMGPIDGSGFWSHQK